MDARLVTPAFEHVVGTLSPLVQAAVREAANEVEMHAEACWHAHDPVPELVVGLVSAPPARLVKLAHAAAPAHAGTIERWLAALPGAHDLGFKVGHHGVQVYARGRITATMATDAFVTAGVEVHPPQAANLLALLDQPDLAMVGLELEGDRADGALYASVARVPTTARAVEDAVRFLVRVVAPDHVAAWDDVAPALFDAPADEIVYVSLSASAEWAWAKVDVGVRQLGAAVAVANRLGTGAVDATLEAARELGGDRWSHLGVRFGSSFGPAFYLPIAGDRD